MQSQSAKGLSGMISAAPVRFPPCTGSVSISGSTALLKGYLSGGSRRDKHGSVDNVRTYTISSWTVREESAISAAPTGLSNRKNKNSDVTSNSLTSTLLSGLLLKHQESKSKH